MSTRLLEVNDLSVRYGALEALKSASLYLEEGEIVTVLGANGAGKSTLLRAISCLLPPAAGEIRFVGKPLGRVAPYDAVQMGISHAPEGRKVFSTLTVQENLALGAFTRRRQKSEVQAARDRVFGLFPLLKDRRQQLAGTLSGGEQQMLAIGRALMSTPRLLLLDEPSLGLAPILVELIFTIILEINRQGVSILLVEQNA
ncbi:MAG TPA: ABC transporter ATP-binding protein, partial [Spirochaetia bacterium]|nr:ABC transporter ATP-binding protein [Spirochaetia bacterium]